MDTPAPAPAPPEPVAPTISAGMDAAIKRDFPAFEASEQALRSGKPLADVPAPAKDPAAPPAESKPPVAAVPERKTSKEQDELNDKIRRAVDRTTTELRAEIARLQAQIPAPTSPAPAAPPPAETPQAEWKRLASLPGAPKLADFDSLEDHAAAMALFVSDTRDAERKAAAKAESTQQDARAAERARVEAFVGRINDAKAADPDFSNKLTPEVRAIKPFGALTTGEVGGPINVIGEHVYDSPVATQILLHFSQHPEALTELLTLPAAIAAMPEALRASAHIKHIAREFAKLETRFEPAPAASSPPAAVPSAISAAPPPAPVLTKPATSSDPKAAAVARGDFATFDKLEMASKRQQRGAA